MIFTLLQVRRVVENAGLECCFAPFWEAKQIEGAFSGPHN